MTSPAPTRPQIIDGIFVVEEQLFEIDTPCLKMAEQTPAVVRELCRRGEYVPARPWFVRLLNGGD